jgi:hypothetical protein
VERREASAPEAGGSRKRIVRGARRARSADRWQHLFVWCGPFDLRLPALRLPSFYLEAKHQWLSFLLQNSGAKGAARTMTLIRPRDSGGGDHWSSRSERTVVEGAHDSKFRCRCRKILQREEASEQTRSEQKCLEVTETLAVR